MLFIRVNPLYRRYPCSIKANKTRMKRIDYIYADFKFLKPLNF